MSSVRSESIIENKQLYRKIVYAINKAVSQDIPKNNRENHLETNNRNIFATSDFINENLRNHVVDDNNIELIAFNRFSWEGRIIVDKKNKITYTISSYQTLKTVIKKHRNRPHYLMTLLYGENGDCKGTSKQMSLGDYLPDFDDSIFDEDTLLDDYDKIMRGSINVSDGYKHYIVVYKSENYMISQIELLFLDKGFEVIESKDLSEYVTPDFAALSDEQYEDLEDEAEHESKKNMVQLKPSVKLKLRSVEDEA